MKIQQILEGINSQIMSYSNEMLASFNKLDDEISAKEIILQNKIVEYLDLVNLISKNKESNDQKIKELVSRENSLNESINIYNKKKLELDKDIESKSLLKDELIDIKNSISLLIKDKLNKESEVSILNQSIDILVGDLEDKKNEFDKISSDIKSILSKRDEYNDSVFKDMEKAKIDREEYIKSTEKDRVFIKERMSSIETKEKELRIKDDSLKIIEARYIKMFGDKGITIKV